MVSPGPRSAQPIAETDRLSVRPWRPEEAPRLLDVLRRAEVTRWLGASHARPLVTLAEAEARIRTYTEMTLATPLGVWAVVPHGEQAAGTVMLIEVAGALGDVEVGWYLHPDAEGRGLATDAAAEALRHGFSRGLGTIWARMHPDNRASQAVCERLGMTPDTAGRARREGWDDGSSRVFGMTRRRWRDR